jgi:hypothetical protein
VVERLLPKQDIVSSSLITRSSQQSTALLKGGAFVLYRLEQLPEPYTKDLYDQKCEVVYQHVYEAYMGIVKIRTDKSHHLIMGGKCPLHKTGF